MRVEKNGDVVHVVFTRSETYRWARRSGNIWPGSVLSDEVVAYYLDPQTLVPMLIRSSGGELDVSHQYEAMAMLDDHMEEIELALEGALA